MTILGEIPDEFQRAVKSIYALALRGDMDANGVAGGNGRVMHWHYLKNTKTMTVRFEKDPPADVVKTPRELIAAEYNGIAPFEPHDLEKKGHEWRTNFVTDANLKTINFLEALATQHHRQALLTILAQRANNAVRDNRP